jgi:hypothetical protein
MGTFLAKVTARWAPLLSVLYLAGSGILKAAGQVDAASTLDFLAGMLGLAISDPEVGASLAAGAGALWKTGKNFAAAVDAYLNPSE